MSWQVPIDIYLGTPNATAAQWYNAMVSALLANENTPSEDDVANLMHPIAQYAAAVTFDRWTVSADVDMEPELRAKVDAHLDDPIKTAPLPADDGIDRNAEDSVFDENLDVCTFIGRMAQQAMNHRHMESNAYGNDIIWMLGEKAPGSRPEFKSTAFDIFIDCFISEVWYVFESVLPDNCYYEYDRAFGSGH